jgi:D-alanyl-D-alanine carboxypeptidase
MFLATESMKQKQLVILTFWMLLITTGCRDNRSILVPLERGISSRLQTLETKTKDQASFPLETESALQIALEQHTRAENLSGAVLAVASASSAQMWMGAASQSDPASAQLGPTDRFAIGNLSEMWIAVVCLQLVNEDTVSPVAPRRSDSTPARNPGSYPPPVA